MTNQQEITTAPTERRPTLDVAEAAALLGVSPWLVLQQIARATCRTSGSAGASSSRGRPS